MDFRHNEYALIQDLFLSIDDLSIFFLFFFLRLFLVFFFCWFWNRFAHNLIFYITHLPVHFHSIEPSLKYSAQLKIFNLLGAKRIQMHNWQKHKTFFSLPVPLFPCFCFRIPPNYTWRNNKYRRMIKSFFAFITFYSDTKWSAL